MYSFKIFYKDGTSLVLRCKASKPENLFYDVDGLMDCEEYKNLPNKKLMTFEILTLASKLFKGRYKDFYKLEIVNIYTNEIVDFIELDKK